MKRYWIAAGTLLMTVGLFGGIYSLRAAGSHLLYYRAKYGAGSKLAPSECSREYGEPAVRLYPHNYELSAHFCHTCLEKRPVDIELLKSWCERGMEQNPYRWIFRYTRAELLARDNPAAAVAYWKEILDWQFWSTRNLSVMVKLCAGAGALEEAAEYLSLLKGRKNYKKAAAALRQAWLRDMQAPAE